MHVSVTSDPAESYVKKGEVMRVGSKTEPGAVAGAITHSVRRHGEALLCTIGAGALNQAIKAVAISAQFLATEGVLIAVVPTFDKIEIDGNERTSLRLTVVKLSP